MDQKLMKISKGQLDDFNAYRTAGDIAANKVFNVLRSQSRNASFTIPRVKIAGSVGKRTSLGTSYQPDFDLVVFVDNEEPPFDDLLLEFEDMLSRNYQNTDENYVYEKITSYSLQFKLRVTDSYSEFRGMYISFDLLPAVNFLSPEHELLSEYQRERTQVEKTLREISELDEPEKEWNLYSSSLCEMGISFVRDQSDFVHDVIRLAKLWNKGVSIDELVYGRSMMIELVAIFAASDEEDDAENEGRTESISNAFQTFLNMFINFDANMWVSFQYQTNPNQRLPYEMYQMQLKRRPLVLDPVNPYNNLAENLSYRAKRAFENHARRARNRCNEWGIDSFFKE